MQLAFLQFFGGILLLYLGGSALVRGSASLAVQLGVRPLVAGLTIVAFGTSAPELAVTLEAALEGFNDIAVGNVVGSNVCNLALILGLSALISPVRVDPQLFRLDIPVMLGGSALLVVLLLDGRLTRAEGGLFVLGIAAYVSLHLWLAVLRRRKRATVAAVSPALRESRVALDAAFVLGGLVALAGGGYFAVHGGVELAAAYGVSHAVIALTVVAVGTSLPELFTTLIAAFRKQGDIAVGNVIGSNIFNLFAVLGITACVRPLVRGGVGWLDLAVMLSVAILVVPLARNGLRLGRREGALLLLCYGAYSSWRLAAR